MIKQFELLNEDELDEINGGSISGFFAGLSAIAFGVAAVGIAIVSAPVSIPVAVGGFYLGSLSTGAGLACTISNVFN